MLLLAFRQCDFTVCERRGDVRPGTEQRCGRTQSGSCQSKRLWRESGSATARTRMRTSMPHSTSSALSKRCWLLRCDAMLRCDRAGDVGRCGVALAGRAARGAAGAGAARLDGPTAPTHAAFRQPRAPCQRVQPALGALRDASARARACKYLK
eukprot:138591-Rhodomonas_salina.1